MGKCRGKASIGAMGLVRFALRFPYTFYVAAALILFLGSIAAWTMRTDIFPEIRIPVVTVIWSYTGLSTPEMEQRVTTYSQYSISSNVNGIKNMDLATPGTMAPANATGAAATPGVSPASPSGC